MQDSFQPAQRPQAALGIGATAVAVLVTAVDIARALVAEILAGLPPGTADLRGWTSVLIGVLGLTVVATVPLLASALVLTGSWWSQVRRFGDALNPAYPHARGTWVAFGGWLVPVLFLWFPYQFVRDALRTISGSRSSRLLAAWWAGWLLYAVTLCDAVVSVPDDLRDFSGAAGPAALHAVVSVVALALWSAVLSRSLAAVRAVGPAASAAPAEDADAWQAAEYAGWSSLVGAQALPEPSGSGGRPAP